MKYGVLRYSYSNNIGDEIQSIAASRFLPRIDLTIERDRLYWHKQDGSITVPFNGWFTRPPFSSCWPPPPNIRPIFVSWHAVMPETLINETTIEYFRHFEPIGCRSLPTIKRFEKLGVSAYHSGCLTLTLPESREERSDDILIVDADPDLVQSLVPANVRAKAKYLTHLTTSAHISSDTGLSLSDLYLKALNRVDRDMRVRRRHRERLLCARHTARMQTAQERLYSYSRARLVITGLLHCSMPCLALGTPVVLMRKDLNTNGRFDGLKQLVRYSSDGSAKVDINWDRPEPNNDRYKDMAISLEQTCRAALDRYRDHETCVAPARDTHY